MDHEIRITTSIAPNTDLLEVHIPHLPFSVVSAWFLAGSRFDPQHKEGLAHLFEHLFLTRSRAFKTNEERLVALAQQGIVFNAFTASEFSYYYHSQRPEHTTKSLSILLESLQEPLFTPEDLAKERGVVLNEAEQNKHTPADYIWQLRKKALWPTHPIGRSFFGDHESLNLISIKDLEEFYARRYQNGKKLVCIFSPEKKTDYANSIRAHIGTGAKRTDTTEPSPGYQRENPIARIIEKTEHDDIRVSVAYRTFPISQEQSVLHINVIRDYLANYWTSRLIQILRIEKALTYWTQATTEHFSDTGYLAFELSTKKEHVPQVIEIIEQEIKKIAAGDIDTTVLKHTIALYNTSKTSSLLTPEGLLWWYGESCLHNTTVMNPTHYFESLTTINKDTLQEIARTCLTDANKSIVLIGNIS